MTSRQDIVIKPADKGGRIVVWRKDLYMQEGYSQLNSPSYKKLKKDPTRNLNNQIIKAINEEISSNNLPPNARKLYSQHPRTSLFYMLPKIHKPDNPGRPIVSAVSCPTTHIATYLDQLLTPLVKQLPTYIKDSSAALRVFKDFRFSGDHRYLFTMDVKSLYTVIPHKDGLLALKHFLNKRTIQNPPTDTLIRLAELVLTTNAFLFNNDTYLQTSGVAMGSKLGPAYACLFVGHQEELIFQSYTGPLPCLLMRYIDDVVGATSLPLDHLQSFVHFVNNFHPALEFTHIITEDSLSFLDIQLSISKDRISTSVHYKETDAHCYFDYNSSHPQKCKDSIPYSQFRRLRRLCSLDQDFQARTEEMSTFFHNSKYPPNITTSAMAKVSNLTQEASLVPVNNQTTQERIPLTLTFHPLSKQVKNIIYNNFHLLTDDDETSEIFQTPPLMAYRRDKNMKDLLVRTKLPSTTELSGTTPCNNHKCRTCTHIDPSTTVTNNKKVFHINAHFSCSSACLIYCISCNACGMLYIGETSRQLNARFGEHLRNVEKKVHLQDAHKDDPDSTVSLHFNSIGHTINDMKITGLSFASSDSIKRKTLEKRIIFKLGTLVPVGLNKQFSYLS